MKVPSMNLFSRFLRTPQSLSHLQSDRTRLRLCFVVLRQHTTIHPTTAKNPQANAICERLHQTVTNVLRPLLHIHPPQDINEANLIMDTALQTASYSARAAIHHTLQTNPGALAFHRDMLLNIPVIAD